MSFPFNTQKWRVCFAIRYENNLFVKQCVIICMYTRLFLRQFDYIRHKTKQSRYKSKTLLRALYRDNAHHHFSHWTEIWKKRFLREYFVKSLSICEGLFIWVAKEDRGDIISLEKLYPFQKRAARFKKFGVPKEVRAIYCEVKNNIITRFYFRRRKYIYSAFKIKRLSKDVQSHNKIRFSGFKI